MGARRRSPSGFPSIRQVAERAGVSSATASRALSERGYSSGAARARVVAAAEELGYEPHLAARSLRAQSSRVIGVQIQDVTNPFYGFLAQGIAAASRAAAYVPLLFDCQEDAAREAQNLRVMLQTRVDGVLIVPTTGNRTLLERFESHGIPVVQIDRLTPGLRTDAVIVDNDLGAYEATSHLLALGHTRIGVIAGPSTLTTGRQRLAGFERALRDHGVELDDRLVRTSDYRRDTGLALAEELLRLRPPPTAIFAHNSVLTGRVLGAIARAGLRVPDDVAVVGFDDSEWATLVSPALTVVSQPATTIGSVATDMLFERLGSGADRPVRTVELEPTLLVRGSCGALG